MYKEIIFALLVSIFYLVFLENTSYAQAWQCGNKTEELTEAPYIGAVPHNVVVVYLDFRDGRTIIGDKSPETDAELEQVQNIDASVLMGYISNSNAPNTWTKKARKYTYLDCWNRLFSVNTFLGSAHPDWESHGIFGYPKISSPLGCDAPPGDTAKGFGSVKEYFNEATYGNVTIEPYQIRSGLSYQYNTGIVNNITDEINGQRYIIPVKLPLNKSDYDLRGGWNGANILAAAINAVNSQTSFNLTNYLNASVNNKVIYIYAGSNPGVGGFADLGGQRLIVREKLSPNTISGSCRSVIEGIGVICHEYGHILGWDHTSLGNYCIMNTGTDNQNCPSHPNMLYKLKAGWIQNVKKINSITESFTLEPSITAQNEKCAVVTIYGKAGYNNDYTHSEYFIVENRRMIWDNPLIKFDKKIVWRKDLSPPTPENFNGGLLVIHYSPYKHLHEYPELGIQKDHLLKSASRELIADPQFPQFKIFVDDGNSRDFFGVVTSRVPVPIIDKLEEDKTISSFNLFTGIELQNINTPTGTRNINFKAQYNLGAPPDYNIINKSPYNATTNLSGLVFMHSMSFTNTQLNIAPGTLIDCLDPKITILSNSNIDAIGTSEEPITYRGCGYDQYRINFNGIFVGNRPASSSTNQPTRFEYCNLINPVGDFAIQIATTVPTAVPLILANNFTDKPDAKIEIGPTGGGLLIQNIYNNMMDIHFKSTTNSIKILEGIHIPENKTGYFYPSSNGAYYLLADDAAFNIEGKLTAIGNSVTDKIIFDRITPSGYGHPTMDIWGGVDFKYCDFKNLIGLTITYPTLPVKVENCYFENNLWWDLSINGFTSQPVGNVLIKDNTFVSNPTHMSSVLLYNGSHLELINNVFNNVNNTGIQLNNVIAPNIKENNITGSGTGINGIISYTSGGTYECNEIISFSNGIFLDNSSPVLYNNYIAGNVRGLSMINASHPVLSVSSDGVNQLINAGFNSIQNNSQEEIYCNNTFMLATSLPILNNGKNSIFDLNGNCLINTNITTPSALIAQQNYWGNSPHPLASDFCPEGSVDYSFPLEISISPPTSCNTSIMQANFNLPQEEILLGSANIDFFNGNYVSAISKYKNYITYVNDPDKSYFPVSRIFYATSLMNGNFGELESYYSQLAQQFINDTNFNNKTLSFSTAADVEQSTYGEAISEYESVISSSSNPNEVFYAYIDKMRTIDLQLYSGGMGNLPEGGSQSSLLNDLEKTINEFINYKPAIIYIQQTTAHKIESIDNAKTEIVTNKEEVNKKVESNNAKFSKSILDLKKSLDISEINIRNKSKKEISKLINNAISFKIFEHVLDYSSQEKIPVFVKNVKKNPNNNLPKMFKLYQNYPNPFNPLSTIKYDIPKQSQVHITIFDILGREITTLINELKEPGYYEISFDGSKYSSGVYFYRIEAGSFIDVKKMVLLK